VMKHRVKSYDELCLLTGGIRAMHILIPKSLINAKKMSQR